MPGDSNSNAMEGGGREGGRGEGGDVKTLGYNRRHIYMRLKWACHSQGFHYCESVLSLMLGA